MAKVTLVQLSKTYPEKTGPGATAVKGEIDARVREATAMLGLEHNLEPRPKALPGGQHKCVSVGRAIVRSPRYFSSTSRSPTSTPRCAYPRAASSPNKRVDA